MNTKKMKSNLFIGLMSGTSMDGIDAVIIELPSNRLISGLTRPYSVHAKTALENILNKDLASLKDFSQLNTLLGREFAQATLDLLEQAQIPASAIEAIGSHGQTLCHDASAEIPYTLQMGCAHTIAELTGIPVVADFRTRDLVAGGQGAPFAPLYHQALFPSESYPLAVINIGGIANITMLCEHEAISGYDLGPGNCLMDAWIKRHKHLDYDKSGSWAATGQLIRPMLDQMLKDAYFDLPAPKSLGKEYYSLAWLQSFLKPDYKPEDVQATLLYFTAMGIVKGIQLLKEQPKTIFICGGGAHNERLITTLQTLLPDIAVLSTQAVDISPDFIEAALFAWLAEKTLTQTPIDLKTITGSQRPIILGAIYPAGIDKGISNRV